MGKFAGIFVEKGESKAAEVNTGRPKTSKTESFATIVNASDTVFVATQFFVHETIFFMFSCLLYLLEKFDNCIFHNVCRKLTCVFF